MSSNQRETTIAFFDYTEGLVKPKLTKTKWVLMRLDATTLTDKKQICNFKRYRENKNSLPSENKNKFSLL
jgi:hypothetical protein